MSTQRVAGLLPALVIGFCLVTTAAPAQEAPTTYLAEEDTFSFDLPGLETMTVTARRITIEDIIRAIGERIEADQHKIRSQESTFLNTLIAYDTDDPDCDDYTIYESADRQRINVDESLQSVALWQRERRFEDGKPVEDDKKDEKEKKQEMTAEWHDLSETIGFAAPFDPASAEKYHYKIEDRMLVGNNVVYRIGFEPRNRFEALPSGTVWVDYTDLVLRRIEARYVDAVPFPVAIEAVPFLRITARKVGDFWVADQVHAKVRLHPLPIPKWPARIEMRMVMKDYEINGTAYDDDGNPLPVEPQEGGER